MKNAFILLALRVDLCGCQAVGEVADDLALDAYGDECNSTLS